MSETREEYKVTEPMQPSRELDALVARAMGHTIEWRWCVRDPECYGQNHSGFSEIESLYDGADEAYTLEKLQLMAVRKSFERLPCIVTIFNNGDKYYQVCFPYSTEPTAAMEAWEWLARERHRPRMFTWDDMSTTVGIGVVKDDRLHQIETNGIDYKHAIALAVCEAGRHLGLIWIKSAL